MNELDKIWRVVRTKSNHWFIVSFPDNKHNVFGQIKKRYNYVSVPMFINQAREMLNKLHKDKM
jgi:hypothetical protein